MDRNGADKYILALDDDAFVLAFIKDMCVSAQVDCEAASTVLEAQKIISERGPCALAIVDLFLEGDRGDALSNDLIEKHIITDAIPYIRFTSAPTLVPSFLSGLGIFDKRTILSHPDPLFNLILSM